MSIPEIIDKIKSKTGIDKTTILYLFIIVGVGIGSFCLGKISQQRNFPDVDNIIKTQDIVQNSSIPVQNVNSNISSQATQINPVEKRYIASKNGKMFYTLNCGGAKRIKPENAIWFATREDAEKSGFTFSSMCKE